jgi:hypothetical protein
MSSPTDHTTYPKSFEARRQLKGLCEEPIDLPISRFYELLQFQYNDSYFRKVNTEAELQEEIKVGMTNLENAEKLLHVVQGYLNPNKNRFSQVSNIFLGLLEHCLERLVIRSDNTVYYLKNQIHAKDIEDMNKKALLEKRREKRRRYRSNKAKRNKPVECHCMLCCQENQCNCRQEFKDRRQETKCRCGILHPISVTYT